MISAKNKPGAYAPKFSLKRMFRSLDAVQDFVVFLMGILLVFKMMLILVDVFVALQTGVDFKAVASQSLFLLILVELFRLLAVYLDHHRIYVGIAVEVAVVSILREVIVEGLIHMDAMLVFAMCSFLFVLGGLMFISHKVEGDIEH